MPGRRLSFGPFQVDQETQVVLRDGTPLSVGQRGVMLLEALLSRPGEVLTKGELMDAAWQGAAVEESNLSVQVAALRKALGRAPDGGDWIATIPRIGYRFVGATPGPANDTEWPVGRRSIAVLPFTNLSTEREQELFADGLAEDIITNLSKLSGLLVIARNSSFTYRGAAVDVRRVGTELGVGYVLEGSVRKSGTRLRLTVQLVDAESGHHLWAERYDRELTDLFEIQDDLTARVVAALEVKLSPTDRTTASRRAIDPEARHLYALGRELVRGAVQNPEVYARIVELLTRASELDRTFAAPLAALGEIYCLDFTNRWTDQAETSLQRATAAANASLKLDAEQDYAHGVLALVAMLERDAERAMSESEKALAINPNSAMAHAVRGSALTASGRPLEAITYIERAMRIEPVAHQYPLHHLGFAHLVAGRYETAAALFRERIMLVPGTDMSRAYLCSALGHLGRVEEAKRLWDEMKVINPKWSTAERLSLGSHCSPKATIVSSTASVRPGCRWTRLSRNGHSAAWRVPWPSQLRSRGRDVARSFRAR